MMHNSNIKYVDGNGTSHTLIKNSSAAILEAASQRNGAYYLASKLCRRSAVQQIHMPPAQTVKNRRSWAFITIIISAYSGGMEGLEWASVISTMRLPIRPITAVKALSAVQNYCFERQYMTDGSTYGNIIGRFYTGSGNSFSTTVSYYIINSNDVLKKIFQYDNRGQTLTNQLSVARRISQRAFKVSNTAIAKIQCQ
ncbi:MAG: hypothetical protein ACLR6O_02860 [Eubacterium sp.]